MKIIPIEAVPSQNLNVVLGQQNCSIAIYQKSGLIYVDVKVSRQPLIYAALARNRVPIFRSAYLGFIGNLMFVDTQGSSDPEYSGLNSRWLLVYSEEGEA